MAPPALPPRRGPGSEAPDRGLGARPGLAASGMRALRLVALLACLAVAVAAAGCGESERPTGPPARVELALDFQPNAVHAGLYAALREDRRHGLDLSVRAPSASTDSLKLLGSGRADFSIVDIHDLGLARARGADVVGVAALVDRPLAAVIARSGIRRPRDLEGARVGVTGLPSDEAVLRSVVESDGGDPARVELVTIGFSAVASLVAARVDAATTFWSAEGVALRRRGTATREFRVDDFGAPPYPELVIATRRRTLERERSVVERLIQAVRAGTAAALRDREAAVREMARASGADEGLVRAQLDALAPVLSRSLRLDRRALEEWARFEVRFGILDRPPDVDRAFDFGAAAR